MRLEQNPTVRRADPSALRGAERMTHPQGVQKRLRTRLRATRDHGYEMPSVLDPTNRLENPIRDRLFTRHERAIQIKRQQKGFKTHPSRLTPSHEADCLKSTSL